MTVWRPKAESGLDHLYLGPTGHLLTWPVLDVMNRDGDRDGRKTQSSFQAFTIHLHPVKTTQVGSSPGASDLGLRPENLHF